MFRITFQASLKLHQHVLEISNVANQQLQGCCIVRVIAHQRCLSTGKAVHNTWASRALSEFQ